MQFEWPEANNVAVLPRKLPSPPGSPRPSTMRQTLIKLGHPQPHTPMQTDNATAHALLTNKILPKALKAMEMCFHWLRCRDAQGQFRYYWRPGTQNLADYFTKHHPPTHHKSVCPTILTDVNNPEYRKFFVTHNASSPQTNVESSVNVNEQSRNADEQSRNSGQQGIPTKKVSVHKIPLSKLSFRHPSSKT